MKNTKLAVLSATFLVASLSGQTWLLQSPPTSPPGRIQHVMAYDEARQHMIVFGGVADGVGRFGDTWTWDGTTWSQLPGSGPSARQDSAMVYDSARQRMLLFGGDKLTGTATADAA